MEVVYKRYCVRCKTTADLLPNPYNISPPRKSDGTRFGYFFCNPCNTARGLKYRQTENGASRVYASQRRSDARYPDKRRARTKVRDALAQGKLVRPGRCEQCLREAKLDAHHPDYKEPLNVIWMCRKCHIRLHHAQRDGA